MRKNIRLLIGILSLQLNLFAQGDWHILQNPLPTVNELDAVQFVNDSVGWAVGRQGTIIKTIDGGVNWFKQVSRVPYTLYAVSFVNQNIGWTAGDGGTILRTTDGGEQWIGRTYLGETYNSVYFIDENNGWIVGYSGIIYATTDGGISWAKQISGTVSWLQSIQFIKFQNRLDCGLGWNNLKNHR